MYCLRNCSGYFLRKLYHNRFSSFVASFRRRCAFSFKSLFRSMAILFLRKCMHQHACRRSSSGLALLGHLPPGGRYNRLRLLNHPHRFSRFCRHSPRGHNTSLSYHKAHRYREIKSQVCYPVSSNKTNTEPMSFDWSTVAMLQKCTNVGLHSQGASKQHLAYPLDANVPLLY